MELSYQKNPQKNILKENPQVAQIIKFKKYQESTLKKYEQKYNKEWQLQMIRTYRLTPASSTTYYTITIIVHLFIQKRQLYSSIKASHSKLQLVCLLLDFFVNLLFL